MIRRSFLASGGLLLCCGCVSDSEQGSQADSKFTVTNERDTELDVSIRLMDGERAFAVDGFRLDDSETGRFTAGFSNVEGDMSIAAKLLSPQEATYEQTGIPVGVPEYNISIQSDGINVIWAEN